MYDGTVMAVIAMRLASALVAGALAGVLAGCGVSGRPASPGPATPPTAPSPTSQPPSSESSPPDGNGSADTVPDVVGLHLDQAEAQLRGEGFLSIKRIDGTGQNRSILRTDNWVVTGQDPAAGSPVTPGVTVVLKATKPTDDLPTIDVSPGTVPDVRCHDLQSAQDALRKAGYYLLVANDGLGQHRYPALDRDWIVVGQSEPPGSAPKRTTTIHLTVVKYGEPTGQSGCRS